MNAQRFHDAIKTRDGELAQVLPAISRLPVYDRAPRRRGGIRVLSRRTGKQRPSVVFTIHGKTTARLFGTSFRCYGAYAAGRDMVPDRTTRLDQAGRHDRYDKYLYSTINTREGTVGRRGRLCPPNVQGWADRHPPDDFSPSAKFCDAPQTPAHAERCSPVWSYGNGCAWNTGAWSRHP